MPRPIRPFVFMIAISVVVLFTPTWVIVLISGSEKASSIPAMDKVIHLVLFSMLAITGLRGRLPTMPLLAVLGEYAVLSELLQMTPLVARRGDINDLTVDIAGILVGWLFYRLMFSQSPAQ